MVVSPLSTLEKIEAPSAIPSHGKLEATATGDKGFASVRRTFPNAEGAHPGPRGNDRTDYTGGRTVPAHPRRDAPSENEGSRVETVSFDSIGNIFPRGCRAEGADRREASVTLGEYAETRNIAELYMRVFNSVINSKNR